MNACKLAMLVLGVSMSAAFADSIEIRANNFNGYRHKLSIVFRGEAKKVKISGGNSESLVVSAKPGESLDGKEMNFETVTGDSGLRRSSSVITVDTQSPKKYSAKVGDRVPTATRLALE